MPESITKHIKHLLAGIAKKPLSYARFQNQLDAKSAPATKIAQRQLFNYYQQTLSQGMSFQLADTGFRNYSQFEEDGILLYIFAAIGTPNKTFVDLGSGDGINSNCANLAINFGWNGLFIDGHEERINTGKKFYENHPDTWLYPPKFSQAFIQRENINDLIKNNGFSGDIDLLSIDLDGNDYWVWEALNAVSPRVVMIETHIEFGLESIVVPYDKDYRYPGKHPHYHGASPVAMTKLAVRKGYRLVGANEYGFNMIYVRQDIGEDILPERPVEALLAHPRNKERFKLFDAIRDWDYIRIE